MSTRPVTPAPGLRRWLALALLGTAFFMVILDGTIVYVALPQIAAVGVGTPRAKPACWPSW
jgi:hypothetical protein